MKKFSIALALVLATCSAQPVMANMDSVAKVNEQVNTKLKFQPEAEGKDIWKIPTRYADCEDYALLKRQLLLEEHSFPEEDLEILLILRPIPGNSKAKEGHAVLFVKSQNVILDNPPAENNRQNIRPIAFSDYIAAGNKVYCVFGDISTSKQYAKVTDRCKK